MTHYPNNTGLARNNCYTRPGKELEEGSVPKLIVVPMDDAEKLKQAVDVAKRCASVGRTEVVG